MSDTEYNSKYTGQEIDDAITLALPGGAIDIALSNKAPAGYGLGTTPKKITDWNDAKLSGWYWSDTGALNSPDSNMWFFGIVHNANNPEVFVQEVWYYPNVNMVYHWQRFYYPGTGNGTPWEWIDPPMELGVEYRTTWRYQGKPVYAKLVNFGVLPNCASKSVAHGITELATVLYANGTIGYGTLLAYPNVSGITLDNTNITITTTADLTGFASRVTLLYYKYSD